MKQYSSYNVEIFDRDFNLVSHTNVSRPSFSVDYLSPVNNEITVFNVDAQKGDYIRIHSGDDEFFGIVTGAVSHDKKTMTISYMDFLKILDLDIVFDTNLQGTSNLETIIANLITDLFINNSDNEQNITGLSVTTSSSTADWGFNLKSDTEGMHHCIVNFYETIIVRALEKYSVAVTATPNVQAKTIALTIGRVSADVRTIEADLPNVVYKNIIIKETQKDVNKLMVVNTENYTDIRTYYRHSDDTYSTTDTDRITPVVREVHGVAPDEQRTFAQVADSDAADTFGNIEYNNLIELVVTNDDTLVKPYELQIGQVVSILSKGNSYGSVLTGKTVSDRTQLTFGTIRLDLTKIIKRRYG